MPTISYVTRIFGYIVYCWHFLLLRNIVTRDIHTVQELSTYTYTINIWIVVIQHMGNVMYNNVDGYFQQCLCASVYGWSVLLNIHADVHVADNVAWWSTNLLDKRVQCTISKWYDIFINSSWNRHAVWVCRIWYVSHNLSQVNKKEIAFSLSNVYVLW